MRICFSTKSFDLLMSHLCEQIHRFTITRIYAELAVLCLSKVWFTHSTRRCLCLYRVYLECRLCTPVLSQCRLLQHSPQASTSWRWMSQVPLLLVQELEHSKCLLQAWQQSLKMAVLKVLPLAVVVITMPQSDQRHLVRALCPGPTARRIKNNTSSKGLIIMHHHHQQQ